MSTDSTSPRIYVACLAAYNSGTLHGEWIDAAQDVGEIEDEVMAMLRASPYPNVVVDCPDCAGLSASDLADMKTDVEERCPTCKGAGKVPSAEEWAIHDIEGFYSLKVAEYESFETVARWAAGIEAEGEAFAVFVDNQGDSVTLDDFQESYQGEWDSLEAYAANYAYDVGLLASVPENLQSYFDMAAFGRDMEMGGDIWTASAGGSSVYVFDNH